MKNLFTVAAAALTLALAGCKYENSSVQYPYYEQLWVESTVGSETTRTENTWTTIAGSPRITAVEQTRNGVPVYNDSEFEYGSALNGNPTQFTRTVSMPEPATELYKNTYSEDKGVQLSAEVYRNGATEPTKWMKREVDGSGRVTRQESFEDGVRSLFTGYVYGSSGYTIKYDSAITTSGETVNTTVQELYTNNERKELSQREVLSGANRVELELWGSNGVYKKYVGENITVSSDGQTLSGETLVVDQSAIASTPGANDTTTETYTRKEYDPATGKFLREVSVRAYYQLVYIKL